MEEKLETEPTVELGSLSTMKSEVFSYTWTIENFANFVDRAYEVSSPNFCFDYRSEIKWRLLLHPESSYPTGVQVALYLMKVSLDGKAQGVRYKVSAIDKDGNHVLLQNREKLFRYSTDFDKCLLIPHNDLIPKKLLPDGALVIRCEMDILSCENSTGSDIDCASLLYEQTRECHDFNNLSVDSLLEEKGTKLIKECDSVYSFNGSKSDLILDRDSCKNNIKMDSMLNSDLHKNDVQMDKKLKSNLCKSDVQMDPKLNSDLRKSSVEMDTYSNSDLCKSDGQMDSKLSSDLYMNGVQMDTKLNSYLCESDGKIDSELNGELCTTGVQIDTKSKSDLCTSDMLMDSLNLLSRDLQILYVSKKLSDVQIRTTSAGISCHKSILSARSEYFRNAFEKSDEVSVMITGVKSTTMEAILYYLYTGKMRDLTVEFALDILTASRKFQLLQLQHIIIDYLKLKMSIGNVNDILQVSEDLELEDLKLYCLKCASSYQLEVTKTAKWDYLLQNNPHIAGEVLLTMSSFQKRNIL